MQIQESYKQLKVWQKSIELSKDIYFLTRQMPKSKTYGLFSQMRRGAISIPSNIAEGYKRNNKGEYINFLGIANGSAAELETQIILAKEFYPEINFVNAVNNILEIQKMLSVMIKKLKEKQSLLNAQRLTLNAKKAFTMIELLVAMGVFITIVGISVGIFVRSLRAQKNIVNLMAINDNASLAMEQMAREIRTGKSFSSPVSDELKFINYQELAVTYRWNKNAEVLERGIGENFKPITASDVKVKNLRFILDGENEEDNEATRITAVLTVGTNQRDLRGVVTNLQTTVSARLLE